MVSFFKSNKGRLSEGPLLAIIMISLTAILTYGIMIPKLGYYYDDWYTIWSGVSRGAESLVPLFSLDRPFMGNIYSFFFRIIGENIAGWHIFALIFRIIGAFAFYWILKLVWPKQRELPILAAMLFVVFPGFLAQPNAATKINHLLGFAGALFSIAFSILALRSGDRMRRYFLIFLSSVLLMFYVWIYEYMIGLEVMRLVLLFYVQWQIKKENIFLVSKKLVKIYIPLLVGIAIFLYWRLFIFESSRNATDLNGLVSSYRNDSITMIMRLVFQTIKDFLSASLFSWFVQPYKLLSTARNGQILIAFIIGAVGIILALTYLYLSKPSNEAQEETEKPWIWIGIGIVIVLGAVLPVVLSNRFLNLNDAYKAYALHPSSGTIIIMLGILLSMKPNIRKITLVVLIGFSVMVQTLNGQTWNGYWETQRNFWWQLTWRAPAIKENTLVMGYLPSDFTFHEDYEIWGPLNLIYHPQPQSFPAIQAQILNLETVAYVSDNELREGKVRDIYTPRDYSKMILIGQPFAGACLHTFDGKMPIYSSNEKQYVNIVAFFSDISRIETNTQAPSPPKSIFGNEPEHGWCYYFQKASLARQQGDWHEISNLFDKATAAGYQPVDTSEYFVFLEGLVNFGELEKAREIANDHIKDNEALRYSLCQSLNSAQPYPDAFGYKQDLIQELICQ